MSNLRKALVTVIAASLAVLILKACTDSTPTSVEPQDPPAIVEAIFGDAAYTSTMSTGNATHGQWEWTGNTEERRNGLWCEYRSTKGPDMLKWFRCPEQP